MNSNQDPNLSKPSLRSGILLSIGTLVFIVFLLFLAEKGVQFYQVKTKGKETFHYEWMQLAKVKGPFIPKEGIINKLGFHSREIPIQKGKNTYRILVLGGSAVYGWKEIETSWVWYLEQRLQKRFPNTTIEVLNGGISGGTTVEELDLLREVLPLNPDLVIAYDGWNDAYYTHYCTDWIEARHRDRSYDSAWAEKVDSFNRKLELSSYSYLALKQSYYAWRKRRKGQALKIEGRNIEDNDLVLNPFKNTDKKNEPIVQCDSPRIFETKSSGKVPDHFTEIFETNILAMHKLTNREKIPFVAILQPALGYTISKNLATPEAKNILNKTSGVFFEDWLNASSQLYANGVSSLNKLQQLEINTLDMSDALQGEDSLFFTDDVHYLDPTALDLIAEKVEHYLVTKKILSKS
jgi:lysophospholipase L1-like esterase